MVWTANDLLEWKDFPKGLRVLLLDEDRDSASEIKLKLEEMEYIVSAFFSEREALSAILNKKESFHVAVVEVSIQNSDGRYKFLEASKDLPTIMTSKEECLSTMMKCIALGAVEFLIKPLSEEKLRNIWQHVVHKAFNAGGSATSESLKSVKEFVGSVLEIQLKNTATQYQVCEEPEHAEMVPHDNEEAICDKFPAPSTPQLKQGGRFLDDVDFQDRTSGSPVKESGDIDGETKSVDTTHGNSAAQMEVDPFQPTVEIAIKEEDSGCESSKCVVDLLPKPHYEVNTVNPGANTKNSQKESDPQNMCGAKGNRKKAKVDWTPDLHKKFVQAVEQLGVDQAIPSRILELMKVEGLTRHNVASHLQKYRMHRRHILPKAEERRWPHPRDSTQRSYYPYKPVMAFPSYLAANHTIAPGQAYPVWGQQTGRPPGFPMWGSPGYPWQPAIETWHWNKPYPGVHADAWGCPVLPPPAYPPSTFSQVQGAHGFHNPDSYGNNSCDLHPGEEVIDKVVKEAISKPWLPLPIGLKPPSTDSVLAELSRQGISTVPPLQINGHQQC